MNRLKNIKGAIFDLDGTLLDSMWVWHDIDKRFFCKRGLVVPSDYVKNIGHRSFRDTAIYTKTRFDLTDTPEELMAEWLSMAQDSYSNRVILKPYANEYLLYLKSQGVKLAIATALDKELYRTVLDSNGIFDLFDGITSVEEVSRGKGYPDIYIKASEKIQVDASDCAVFEDILQGVKGAKKGNFLTVGVFEPSSSEDLEQIKSVADIFIQSFKELL